MQLKLHKNKHRQIIPELHQLDERFNECPFCHSKQTKCIGYIQKTPEINVMTCLHCHIGYIDRQPNETFLREFYAKYYSQGTRHTTIDPHLLANHLIKQFGKLQSKNTYSILDFGGGDGSVSQLLANHLLTSKIARQVNICVVDYNAEDGVSTNIIQRIHVQTIESIPSGIKFDLVIASAILEHVKNPKEIVSNLLNKLEINGLFYARTPYIYPIYKSLYSVGINLDLPYPAHLFDMGNTFWNSFLKTIDRPSDFKIIRSSTSLVERTFKKNPLRTIIAHTLKFPSHIFKNAYTFVGGWEVVIRR